MNISRLADSSQRFVKSSHAGKSATDLSDFQAPMQELLSITRLTRGRRRGRFASVCLAFGGGL